MYPFTYHQPENARKAATVAGKLEDAKFLAGGMTLLPTMKQRLASPANLVDLGKCDDLRGIEVAARVPHSFPSNGHNENYLRTKAERAGHLL